MTYSILRIFPLLFYLIIAPLFQAGTSDQAETLLLLLPIFIFAFQMLYPQRNSPIIITENFRILVLLAGFLFVVAITTPFSHSVIQSTHGLVRWVAIITTLGLLIRQPDRNALKILIFLVIFESTLLSLIWIYISLTGQSEMITSPFFHIAAGHNHLSNYLVLGIPLTSIILIDSRKFRKILFFPLLVMCFALILTYARGAWVALLTILPLYLISHKKDFTLPLIVKIVYIGISLIIFILIQGNLKADFLAKDSPPLRTLSNISSQPLNVITRVKYFEVGAKNFTTHPFLGTGLDTFGFFDYRSGVTVYVHNFFLQLASETGVVATVIFIYYLFLSLRKLRILVNNSSSALFRPLFLALTISLIYSLYDFGWNLSVILVTILSLLTVSITYPEVRSRQHPKIENLAIKILHIQMYLALFGIFIFILLGSLSLYFENKAIALSAAKEYKRSEAFYLSAISTFPLNRNYYRGAIKNYDLFDSSGADIIINKWEKLDEDNGERYHFLALRSLRLGNISAAADYANKAITTTHRKIIDYTLYVEILSKYNPTDPNQFLKTFYLFKTIDNLLPGSFADSFPTNNKENLYQLITTLTESANINILLDEDRALLNYWSAVGQILSDHGDLRGAHQFIGKSSALDPQNSNYRTFLLAVDTIVNNFDIEQTGVVINKLIEAKKQNQDNYEAPKLLALTYQHQANNYFLTGEIGTEIMYRNLAITEAPSLASLRINLILRYLETDQYEKAKETLSQGIDYFGISFNRWYLETSGSSPLL